MVINKFIEEFILTLRKLWQKELITLEELDKYVDSVMKLRKELRKTKEVDKIK